MKISKYIELGLFLSLKYIESASRSKPVKLSRIFISNLRVIVLFLEDTENNKCVPLSGIIKDSSLKML